MRQLVYYVAVSLDGFIAAPDGGFDAFATEGDHLEAILRDYADAIPVHAASALGLTQDRSKFDTVLMGWNTYAVGLPFGIDDPYPHLRQFVFSRQPRVLPSSVEHAREEPPSLVRRLKAEESGTSIWLCGGGRLASALVDEIDRLVLKVNPVLLGSGIPLFSATTTAPLQFDLESSTAFGSGVVINDYVRRSD